MLTRVLCLAMGVLMLTLALQPITVDTESIFGRDIALDDGGVVESAMQDMSDLVRELMAVTTDTNHSDADGMPDSVEWVIGTDPENEDSDFDGLNDYQEVLLGLDPESPDSNNDRFPDLREVEGVPLDLDGDGQQNAWDWDNDGDGVVDHLDLSPYFSTEMVSCAQVDVGYDGDPLFVTFQLRTSDPEHMKLLIQSWDWPADARGTMKDLDGSSDDVTIAPMLKVNSSIMPSQEDILEYGMVIDQGSVFIPLFPVWEMGDIVALKARMFLPSIGSPQELSLEAELVWKVNGRTDVPIVSLGWSYGGHLALGPGGEAVISYEPVEENETLEWKDLGGGKVALAGSNGLYMSVDDNGSVYFSSGELEDRTVFAVAHQEGEAVTLTAFNGNRLAVDLDGNVRALEGNGESMGEFAKEDLGFRAHTVTLAYYYEDFILTGLSAEENLGTETALVFGDDEQNMVAANLLLAYEFLRGPENDLQHIGELLDEHDIAYQMLMAAFATSDQAVRAIATSMMSVARNESDQVGISYYIAALSDRSKCQEISQLVMATGVGGRLSLDLTGMEAVTTRILKTSWYEDEEEAPMDLHEIVAAMGAWGLETDELEVLTALMASWCVGEALITHIGDVPLEFDHPEGEFISETVDSILSMGLGAIDLLMFTVELVTFAYAFSEAFVAAISLAKTATQSAWSLFKQTFTSVRNSVQGAGTFMSRLGTALNVIGITIAVVISLYALFSIGFEMGWSSVGTGIAVTTAIFTLAYALVLIGIASLGPVGAIIAGLIALVDVIGLILFGSTWGQEFLEWLIDVFTDTNVRSEVNLETVGFDSGLVDIDGNGIDAGDRIWFRSWHYGNVTITSDGGQGDVVDSYIVPHQTVGAPWYSGSATGGTTTALEVNLTSGSKSTLYETEAWVEPGIGMVNFPVVIGLRADYNVYYDDCWWFFGWWCDRESYSDSQSTSWTTMYYDVMPGSVHEFSLWKGIVSNDPDGDGLTNDQENITSKWSWDTDQDGLGDEYEIQIGTDPTSADSDHDGVNDREEHIWGLDPWTRDSDRDGLVDGMEHSGWVVNFTYEGAMFYWHVRSNPNLADSDEDGLSDLEEYHSLLNPVSDDTDGDGVKDVLRGYYQVNVEYVTSFGDAFEYGMTNCLAIDDEGMIYSGGYEDTAIHVYHPNGTLERYFDVPDYIGIIEDLDIGPDGNLYVMSPAVVLVMNKTGELLTEIDPFLAGERPYNYLGGIALDDQGYMLLSIDHNDWYGPLDPSMIRKISLNGTYIGNIVVGDFVADEWADVYTKMTIDAEHNIYVVNEGMHKVQVFDQNGVLLREWGENGALPGQFVNPKDISLDVDGNLLVVDSFGGGFEGNAQVQIFSNTGRWMYSFGYLDEYPMMSDAQSIVVNVNNAIYIGEWGAYIHVFDHDTIWIGPDPPLVIDSDGDGLSDEEEELGWEVVVTTEHGHGGMGETFWVISDVYSMDTDRDGLEDPMERSIGSDPRALDTDKDGVRDEEEVILGTDPCHWDSDLDGLSDGKELKFGSDPLHPDSDVDGLNDLMEFGLGSDPRSNDTDQDGLDDLREVLAGSDILDPDSDDDFMFDGTEHKEGTGMNADDSDDDGISDGFELLYMTDPLEGDSDGDALSDGFELAARLDPLSNDTDGDGLNDSFELEEGLNPRSKDSDGDGIPDGLDEDGDIILDQDVILVIDSSQFSLVYYEDLLGRVNVTVVSVEELMDQHLDARYIVLIGDPGNGAGTAGGLIAQLLAGSGDVLDRMVSSPMERMAVRYGVWNATQTVVMFSQLYDTDAIRTVGVLKSMSMTVGERGYLVHYLNPRACFKLDLIDTMHLTDTFIWAKLSGMGTFRVEVEKVNGTDGPAVIDTDHGLNPGWFGLDKYVRMEFLPDDANLSLEGAMVRIYYTTAELDRTGDGDADDLMDVDEGTLRLWRWSSIDGEWSPLDTGCVDVNTTDQDVYGKRYDGYVSVNLTELGWFALAGMTHAIEVRMDVRSVHGNDKISLTSGGQVRVILYGGSEAQAEWIDLGSLTIGDVGIVRLNKQGFKCTIRDVDNDGLEDLVVYFSIPDLVEDGTLTSSSRTLMLNGLLDPEHGSVPIRGTAIVTLPPGQT